MKWNVDRAFKKTEYFVSYFQIQNIPYYELAKTSAKSIAAPTADLFGICPPATPTTERTLLFVCRRGRVCIPRGHKSYAGGTAPRRTHACRGDVSPLILNQRGGLIHCRNRRGGRQCRRESARFSFRLMCGGVLLQQDVTALTIPGTPRKKSSFFIEWQHRIRPGKSVP